ncbi:hypothetical protein ACSBR2_041169 [Camellia fascicularis]
MRCQSILFILNDKDHVTVHCKRRADLGCLWNVHARVVNSSKAFVIKQFDYVHTCGSSFRIAKHARMTSSMIGRLISSEIRNKALTSVSEMVCDFKDYYGTEVSYRRAWMGVEKVRGLVFGDYSSSFNNLRWYVDAANDCNPGSVFDMEFDVDNEGKHFKCLFFAFKACIHGFKYCRPVLILDGTFLKGRHKGRCGRSVQKFLEDLPNECWCNAYFQGKEYGEICTNPVESFNSWIRNERHLFSTSLVDAIWVKLMEQFSKRREVGNKWNHIVCPFAEKKLEEAFNDTKAWIVKKCNDDISKIQLDHSVMVDIGKHSCSC